MPHLEARVAEGHCYLKLTGHAVGDVQKCAALSALVSTLALYLESTDQAETWSAELRPGYAELQAIGTETLEETFGAFLLGLLELVTPTEK